VKEKPTAGSAHFGAFASDRIPNATNDINEYFVIRSSNSSGLYQRNSPNYISEFRELFEATTY